MLEILNVFQSADGSLKIVQAVRDTTARATIETGRYLTQDGDKVCLSSQIGCHMACSFCVTTQPYEYEVGKPVRMLRNLTAEEIYIQACNALDLLPPRSPDLTFAFMGMGEPFNNMGAIRPAINLLGNRYKNARITISTIGHNLSGILNLANAIVQKEFVIKINLHISLHGSNDEKRKEIVPFAKPLKETIEVAENFAIKTGAPVKLNYVLVNGQNASLEDADRLGQLLKNKQHLILKISRLNSDNRAQMVSETEVSAFENRLSDYGVQTYRFSSLGTDIKSGCGELAKGQWRTK